MPEQYKMIKDYTNIFWTPGCPVLAEHASLAQNPGTDGFLLFITFRNIRDLEIREMTVNISENSFASSFHYEDLLVPMGETFGEAIAIPVAFQPEALNITIREIAFADGTFLRESTVLAQLPDPLPTSALGEFEAPYLDFMTEKHPELKITCAPEEKNNYWRCVCHRIYPYSIIRCSACGISKDALFERLYTLEEEKDHRLIEEERRKLKSMPIPEIAKKEPDTVKPVKQKAKSYSEPDKAKKEHTSTEKKSSSKLPLLLLLLLLIAAGTGAFFFLNREKEPVQEASSQTAAENPAASKETPDAQETPDSAEADSEQPASEGTDSPKDSEAESPELPKAPSEEPVAQLELETTISTPEDAKPVDSFQPVAVIGIDLTDQELADVLAMIDMTLEEYNSYDHLAITIDQEKECLKDRFTPDQIGERSLSCMFVTPDEPGSGLTITLKNITTCTEKMYREALTDAGVVDARVVVAGPVKTSGTSALTGAIHIQDILTTE